MTQDVPVIIVGAGPAGLAAGLLLARQGIRSTILERRASRSDHPRAHYVNTRSMELFRQWGVQDDVIAHAFPKEFMFFPILEMMGAPSLAERDLLSPALTTSVAQDLVETALEKRLNTYGLCDIRWGYNVEQVVNGPDAVQVRARTADGREDVLDARWCLAADGASSPIRRQLGVPMIGDPHVDSIINVYFFGRIVGDNDIPSLGAQSIDPDVPGAFINMDGADRHCFHYCLGEGERVEDFDFARCEQLIRRAAGVGPERSIEVRAIKPWTMTAHVAARMRVDSVFLCGDAAHAFPPSGGFGLNSGVQDVHNLAWKLAGTLEGWAGPALLDSYEAERQPVAFLNTAQSFRNAKSMNLRREPKPFNVSPETVAEIDRGAEPTGVKSIAATLEDENARDVEEVLEHGSALGQELGFHYASPVIIADGRPRPEITIARYVPHANPGSRAPHFWLRDGAGRRTAVMDLFDRSFVLLIAEGGSAWRAAADSLLAGPPLKVVSVGEGLDYAADGVDFPALYGIAPDGAVLVRPDGHVAFRSESAPADPAAQLSHALKVASGQAPGRA